MAQAASGGPCYFQVRYNEADQLYYAWFTYNGEAWFKHAQGQATAPAMQTALDTYVGQLNAGTA
jgi:hypothetical protein